ncbi:MAG TPA: NYN domain-containing protein [Allosphingosinicella sp.]|jgi:uncharacterized LabA/DUF88 family protein
MKNLVPSQRVAVFVDYANVNRSASDAGISLNYEDLLTYITANRHLVEAVAYVPIDPNAPAARDGQCEDLWLGGYFVKTKLGKAVGDSYKCNVDVEMTIDILNAALVMSIDTAVLVSGDGDFVPVVEYLRGRGIRVEVCGFQANTARELILKCSGYVDLDYYLSEQESGDVSNGGDLGDLNDLGLDE